MKPEISERAKYISEQSALALSIARAWFAETNPQTEDEYEAIRVWVVARLAERGIGDDEVALEVTLSPESKRAMFNFRMLREGVSETAKA